MTSQSSIDARVCSVISNCTGLPVFRWITVPRSCIRLPTHTSLTRSRTRSQPRSLLSTARLKSARSRQRRSSRKRTRIAQTSFGLSGRFWPVRRSLFQGVLAKPTRDGIAVRMAASSTPTAPPQRGSSVDPRRIIYRRRLCLRKAAFRFRPEVLCRFAPRRTCNEADHSRPASAEERLFNDLVGAGQQRRRDGQAQRLRRLQIDDQLELGRLLDRQVGGLRPLQDLVDERRCAADDVRDFR